MVLHIILERVRCADVCTTLGGLFDVGDVTSPESLRALNQYYCAADDNLRRTYTSDANITFVSLAMAGKS